MSYAICIQAAGTPVLSYHEDGSYQGHWFAYTANGFYQGYYGSCSGCDWREGEMMKADGWPDADSDVGRAIDAGIGREILKKPPMTKDALLAALPEFCLDDSDAVVAWIEGIK